MESNFDIEKFLEELFELESETWMRILWGVIIGSSIYFATHALVTFL